MTTPPADNQKCPKCGYMTADPFNCPTCKERADGRDDPVFSTETGESGERLMEGRRMKNSRLDRSNPYEWQRRSAKRYEDKLRAEGHHKYRRIGSNRERQKKEWARAYGSEERVKAIKAMPSVVSGKTPCVNAHVRDLNRPASGMGRKGDADLIVPLTWEEHQCLHQFGQDSFEDRHGIDLAAEARRIDEELSG